jgi:hypothetical protein
LEIIFAATEKNHTIEKFAIDNGMLSARATLSLASALLLHPTIQELFFASMDITEFGALALAFRKDESLARLKLCRLCTNITPTLMENRRCLLSADALDTLGVSVAHATRTSSLTFLVHLDVTRASKSS